MLLPPEIWNEIVSYTIKRDVLKFKMSLSTVGARRIFKFIVNDDEMVIQDSILDRRNWDPMAYTPTCFLRTGCSLSELIENIDTLEKKQCVLKFVSNNTIYNAMIISINSTKNIFVIERDGGCSASKHTIKFKENKGIICKFLTDLQNEL